ncbi:MAG TPA: hypothetical protein VNI84_21765 [Pyrinomonadaceae bacterium]|nr:hypothetical protein [Pyrinomonadaceae bacterium]
MSENSTAAASEENNSENAEAANSPETANSENAVNPEDVSYHAVEKDGSVTAIWEMQGRKHIRTIAPRSNEGKQILALFETAA